ncbi:MAG: glycosyltransferase, partial [Stellaceae bacterium]
FGLRPGRVALGYDSVSMERVRRLAGAPPAPGGAAHAERHFSIVARLVPKKNIAVALDAYARYCGAEGASARALHICGSGVLEPELRRQAQELGLTRAVFHGFLQAPEIARVLASTLALILPSTEEQWGLVINEALAMGVPVLCSDNVGARDLLVRTAVNGFVFEPDNPEGLARLMQMLARDEAEWRRLAEGSLRLAPLADAANFGSGAASLVRGETRATSALDPAVLVARSK